MCFYILFLTHKTIRSNVLLTLLLGVFLCACSQDKVTNVVVTPQSTSELLYGIFLKNAEQGTCPMAKRAYLESIKPSLIASFDTLLKEEQAIALSQVAEGAIKTAQKSEFSAVIQETASILKQLDLQLHKETRLHLTNLINFLSMDERQIFFMLVENILSDTNFLDAVSRLLSTPTSNPSFYEDLASVTDYLLGHMREVCKAATVPSCQRLYLLSEFTEEFFKMASNKGDIDSSEPLSLRTLMRQFRIHSINWRKLQKKQFKESCLLSMLETFDPRLLTPLYYLPIGSASWIAFLVNPLANDWILSSCMQVTEEELKLVSILLKAGYDKHLVQMISLTKQELSFTPSLLKILLNLLTTLREKPLQFKSAPFYNTFNSKEERDTFIKGSELLRRAFFARTPDHTTVFSTLWTTFEFFARLDPHTCQVEHEQLSAKHVHQSIHDLAEFLSEDLPKLHDLLLESLESGLLKIE